MPKEKKYCLPALIGAIFYTWCEGSHWCICGHLVHEMTVFDRLIDLAWIVSFAFGIVLLRKAPPLYRALSYFLVAAVLLVPAGELLGPLIVLFSLSLLLKNTNASVTKPAVCTKSSLFNASILSKFVAALLDPVALLFVLLFFLWIKTSALLAIWLLAVTVLVVFPQLRFKKQQTNQEREAK